jgi:uncharacterized membrane protein
MWWTGTRATRTELRLDFVERLCHAPIIAAAALSVAVGDLLIKRVASGAPRVSDALFHPLTAAAAGLYAVQVVLFAYVFVRRWQLGKVALLQMAVYAAACILLGRIWFGERVTAAQAVGMLLAFCGAVLMTK